MSLFAGIPHLVSVAAAQTQSIADSKESLHSLPSEAVFTWGGYFQALAVMALLLGMLWGVLWLLRRSGKFRSIPVPGAFPKESLRMEAQIPLGPKKGLAVVRYLNKRLLLGITEHQIVLLQESDLVTPAETEGSYDGQDFAGLLRNAGNSEERGAS